METGGWSERQQRSIENTALGSPRPRLQSQLGAYCVTLGRGRPFLALESLSGNNVVITWCAAASRGCTGCGVHVVIIIVVVPRRMEEEVTACELIAI